MVQSFRLHLDPNCGTVVDNLKAPDCPVESSPSNPTNASPAAINSSAAGEIGGIIVGVVIVVILLMLNVLLVVMMKKWKPKVINRRTYTIVDVGRYRGQSRTAFAQLCMHNYYLITTVMKTVPYLIQTIKAI